MNLTFALLFVLTLRFLSGRTHLPPPEKKKEKRKENVYVKTPKRGCWGLLL